MVKYIRKSIERLFATEINQIETGVEREALTELQIKVFSQFTPLPYPSDLEPLSRVIATTLYAQAQSYEDGISEKDFLTRQTAAIMDILIND